MGKFSGGWKARATAPVLPIPKHPEIHPEHARPVDGPDPQSFEPAGTPLLPDDWAEGQYLQEFVPSAYVDQTPVSHDAPIGFLPGVALEEAQDRAGVARSIDLGAFDARRFERPQYQEDGSRHEERIGSVFDGTSPATLKYQEKGAGVDIDPHARRDRKIWRQATGPAVIDQHWYGNEMRPKAPQHAQGSRERGPVPDRQANTPPEGAGFIMRPDNWAAPILRRTAPEWDQAHTVDAVVGGDFGLGSWGL